MLELANDYSRSNTTLGTQLSHTRHELLWWLRSQSSNLIECFAERIFVVGIAGNFCRLQFAFTQSCRQSLWKDFMGVMLSICNIQIWPHVVPLIDARDSKKPQHFNKLRFRILVLFESIQFRHLSNRNLLEPPKIAIELPFLFHSRQHFLILAFQVQPILKWHSKGSLKPDRYLRRDGRLRLHNGNNVLGRQAGSFCKFLLRHFP